MSACLSQLFCSGLFVRLDLKECGTVMWDGYVYTTQHNTLPQTLSQSLLTPTLPEWSTGLLTNRWKEWLQASNTFSKYPPGILMEAASVQERCWLKTTKTVVFCTCGQDWPFCWQDEAKWCSLQLACMAPLSAFFCHVEVPSQHPCETDWLMG